MKVERESSKKGKVCLGVYITEELHSELVVVAKEKEVPASQIVREALKEYISKKK